MARISVIIPVYNAGQYLSETLNSLLQQTVEDWTCILVNDGSTDDSQAVIDDFCNKDERFVSYVKANEGSPDLARKLAFEKTKTEWAMLLDADDVIEPSYMEKILKRQEQTNAEVICSIMIVCQKGVSGELERFPDTSFNASMVISGKEAFSRTIGGWDFPTGGMFFRLRLTKGVQHGGYINSDEFAFRQILFNASHVAFSDAKYYYRNNNDSISRKPSARFWQNLKVNQEIEDFVWLHYPENQRVRSEAVRTSFFALVSYSAKFWSDGHSLSSPERKKAKKWLREAYDGQNKSRLSTCFPHYYKAFCHGFVWFGLASVVYERMKIIRIRRRALRQKRL